MTFACSGLPTGAACSFQPSSLPASTSQQSVVLTVATSGKFIAVNRAAPNSSLGSVFYTLLTFPVMGMVLLGFAGRGRRATAVRFVSLMLIAMALLAISSCGGAVNNAPPNPNATPAG